MFFREEKTGEVTRHVGGATSAQILQHGGLDCIILDNALGVQERVAQRVLRIDPEQTAIELGNYERLQV